MLTLFIALAKPTWRSMLIGLPLSVIGLLLRTWAAGHLAKNERLATTGPYAFVRNPLYVGSVLVAAGLLIAARDPILPVVFAAVFIGVYLPVIELEEQHLRNIFPDYTRYAERVPLVWPRATPAGDHGGWSSRLWLKNEEWKALLASAAAVAFLAVKASL
jgi:protein-S-isoprenylcysteine O-methyltransferase Ste14